MSAIILFRFEMDTRAEREYAEGRRANRARLIIAEKVTCGLACSQSFRAMQSVSLACSQPSELRAMHAVNLSELRAMHAVSLSEQCSQSVTIGKKYLYPRAVGLA